MTGRFQSCTEQCIYRLWLHSVVATPLSIWNRFFVKHLYIFTSSLREHLQNFPSHSKRSLKLLVLTKEEEC